MVMLNAPTQHENALDTLDDAGEPIVEVKNLSRRFGAKLAEYLDTHFFKPLGMGDTSFVLRPDLKARLVQAAGVKID